MTDITTARTLFVRDCPVRATFVEWGDFLLRIGGYRESSCGGGPAETTGDVAVLDPATMAPPSEDLTRKKTSAVVPARVPPLRNPRHGASAVTLPDGRTVVAGGFREGRDCGSGVA